MDKLQSFIAKTLRAGNIVVFPTDTVYGMLADATNTHAVQKVFEMKKRPVSKALPLFVKSIGEAKKLAYIDSKQEKFLRNHWPGSTTVVLRRKQSRMTLYGVKKDTIALRIPKYKPLQALLKNLSFPVSATSANLAGQSPARTFREVLKQFHTQKSRPDFFVNGGILKGNPSAIVDLTVFPYKTLRT